MALGRADRPMLGIALILSAYFLFSVVDSSAKWLTAAGISAMQVAFMRYLGHVVISGGLVGNSGKLLTCLKTDRIGLVLLRGVMLAGSTVLNFIALKTLSMTLTSTIIFLAPILVCALSWPVLGERIGIYRSAAIVLGFIGVLIAIRPFSETFDWAVFYSLGSAACFGVYSILTRILSTTVTTESMQLYGGLVGAVIFLPFAVLNWESPVGLVDWTILLMIGFFGWLGHELLTRAYTFAEAGNLVPFTYSLMIFLGIWSYVLFDQLPDVWNVCGAAIVVLSGLIIWVRELRLARRRQRA